jgi:ATP-dependent helicase/nuclease subunit A
MAATPRQLQAITRHDVSMVVTAGAGTGKTFVLVEKYLNLLTRFNYHIGDILALTFTEKAAAEMKERIREKVIQCLRDDPDNQVWKTAYDELVMAPIMTFHSFCAHILREFAIEAGIDPGFVILDEAAALAIEREAFEALIRDPSDAIREPLVRLLAQVERYHLHQILLFLSQHIESFILFAQDLERDPEGIITNWEVFLEKTRAPVLKEFFTNSDVCDAISDIIRFERMYTNEDDTAVRYIKNILPYLRELTADASPEQLHAAAKNILAIKRSGNLGSQKNGRKRILHGFAKQRPTLSKVLKGLSLIFRCT